MTVEPSPAPVADTVELGRPTVLVVEDNAEMRTLIREICQVEFDVLEAEDGRRGLELTRKRQPALVISDVMMPGMDGREMLAQLRAEPATASIPVMLLTAKAGGDLRLEGLEGGADDYMIKPFNSRELLARARNLVRLKQQEVALRALNATLERQVLSRTSALERARTLGRYLPPQVVRAIIDEGQAVEVRQERRRLTVFSIELRGFEAVLQAAEPEDVAVMLNGYLSAVIGVAFAAGATIDRFVRDEVVGFFGAPTSEGDQQDAAASVAMARKIWDAAWEVSARWEELLSVPAPSPTMVLTSGLATVGNFGSVERLDYTAVGGAADDVRSLLRALEPGVLACAQSTWSLLDDAARAALELPARTDATLQEVALPDRSQPVSLLRLAGGLDGRDVEETKAESSSARFDATRARDAARSEGPPDQEGELLLDTDGRITAGTLLLDRFEVIRYIGGGGMGTVYQARDQKLELDVAIKLIRQDRVTEPRVRERLYREVKLARLISHENVARIYDLGEWRGHEFISMELIEGQTLRERLNVDGQLPLDFGLRVVRHLCEGLAAAHGAGVVHRDLKPANIMLQRGGRVVILDFGIAKWASTLQTVDNTEGPLGTPSYMAPEQFMGQEVDLRADIYALGVVAFELFTGQLPFISANPYTLAWKHSRTPPPDPVSLRPDLPARIGAIILRCLEKAPQDRFGRVQEILAFLFLPQG